MKKDLPVVTISTASKLSAEQLKSIQSQVEAKIGPAEYKQVVDPKVLGGLRLAIGDQEFDATISGKLEKLESQLQKVVVTTAVPLTAEQHEKITKALEEKVGAMAYSEVVDTTVVGGIKVLIGSRELDATVKGKLNRLKQLLLQTI